MRYQGRLQNWNDQKGFGFVAPNGGGDKAFVHIKAFERLSRRPVEGDIVTYEIARDAQGRLQANAVRFAGQAAKQESDGAPGKFGPIFAVVFCVALVAGVLMQKIPSLVAAAYVAMSVVAFFVYGKDKRAAELGDWRTEEVKLHALGLLCGWPGALFAQRVFRHKSRKREFQATFWGTVVVNIVAMLFLNSASGRAWLGL
ncbi:MAG: DUF1294 domain-containing protein [Lysobacter sp.]|nr:MAG: DUF1294 domain-containing protein [Lysobacter sp.]